MLQPTAAHASEGSSSAQNPIANPQSLMHGSVTPEIVILRPIQRQSGLDRVAAPTWSTASVNMRTLRRH